MHKIYVKQVIIIGLAPNLILTLSQNLSSMSYFSSTPYQSILIPSQNYISASLNHSVKKCAFQLRTRKSFLSHTQIYILDLKGVCLI